MASTLKSTKQPKLPQKKVIMSGRTLAGMPLIAPSGPDPSSRNVTFFSKNEKETELGLSTALGYH